MPSMQRGALLAFVMLGVCSHLVIHRYADAIVELAEHSSTASHAARHPSDAARHPSESRPSAASVSDTTCAASRSGGHLSILVVHEHHLKPIGSDVRLLGVVLQLRSLGHTVSLLFRGRVPSSERSPPTAQLATIIGASTPEAVVMSAGGSGTGRDLPLPPPPAVYEFGNLASLMRLAQAGYFDAVLCTLWFWRDPAPSAAELLLPTLLLHAPPRRRPSLAILSDDAHAARAEMMAGWETSAERKELWLRAARTLPARQRAVYSLADVVVHISASDSALERSLFNRSCAHWGVLRFSPRGMLLAETNTSDAEADATEAGTTEPAAEQTVGRQGAGKDVATRIGFMGHGLTPTNHLSVQWFLMEVWPMLRSKLPGIGLRLVGHPPDDRRKALQSQPCDTATSLVRCGWAWRTPYAGREAEGGIFELGFIADAEVLREELRSWRAMVVPILRTTGVNTKLLPALRWGVPTVLTTAAASPMQIGPDESVALIADDAASFVRKLLRLHEVATEPARLSAGARLHWRRLLREDATASDLRPLLRLACTALSVAEADRPMPTPVSPPVGAALGVELSSAASWRGSESSRCFDGLPPAVYVSMHGAAAPEAEVHLAHAVWATICEQCELVCAHARSARRGGAHPTAWDVLIETEAGARPPEETAEALRVAAGALAPRGLRLVHSPAAQMAAALQFSARGATFASVAQGERARAQLPAALKAVDGQMISHPLELVRSNRTRAAAAVPASWRRLLLWLGVRPAEAERLVSIVVRIASATRLGSAPRWRGCYRAPLGDTVVNGFQGRYTTLTCAAACVGHATFALQDAGRRCFCGAAPLDASKISATGCGDVCEAEEGKTPTRLCGDEATHAVYSNPVSASRTPAAAASHAPKGADRSSARGVRG